MARSSSARASTLEKNRAPVRSRKSRITNEAAPQQGTAAVLRVDRVERLQLNFSFDKVQLAKQASSAEESDDGHAPGLLENGDPSCRRLGIGGENTAALAHRKRDDDYVFTRNGEQVRDFRGAWDKMFQDAGIPRRRFHDLRRSAIRNLVRAGVHPDTCMRISGHRTSSTFRRYNIQSLSDFQEAAEKIEERADRLRAEAVATATEPEGRTEAEGMIQ